MALTQVFPLVGDGWVFAVDPHASSLNRTELLSKERRFPNRRWSLPAV
jgi:hypothetical protein